MKSRIPFILFLLLCIYIAQIHATHKKPNQRRGKPKVTSFDFDPQTILITTPQGTQKLTATPCFKQKFKMKLLVEPSPSQGPLQKIFNPPVKSVNKKRVEERQPTKASRSFISPPTYSLKRDINKSSQSSKAKAIKTHNRSSSSTNNSSPVQKKSPSPQTKPVLNPSSSVNDLREDFDKAALLGNIRSYDINSSLDEKLTILYNIDHLGTQKLARLSKKEVAEVDSIFKNVLQDPQVKKYAQLKKGQLNSPVRLPVKGKTTPRKFQTAKDKEMKIIRGYHHDLKYEDKFEVFKKLNSLMKYHLSSLNEEEKGVMQEVHNKLMNDKTFRDLYSKMRHKELTGTAETVPRGKGR